MLSRSHRWRDARTLPTTVSIYSFLKWKITCIILSCFPFSGNDYFPHIYQSLYFSFFELPVFFCCCCCFTHIAAVGMVPWYARVFPIFSITFPPTFAGLYFVFGFTIKVYFMIQKILHYYITKLTNNLIMDLVLFILFRKIFPF